MEEVDIDHSCPLPRCSSCEGGATAATTFRGLLDSLASQYGTLAAEHKALAAERDTLAAENLRLRGHAAGRAAGDPEKALGPEREMLAVENVRLSVLAGDVDHAEEEECEAEEADAASFRQPKRLSKEAAHTAANGHEASRTSRRAVTTDTVQTTAVSERVLRNSTTMSMVDSLEAETSSFKVRHQWGAYSANESLQLALKEAMEEELEHVARVSTVRRSTHQALARDSEYGLEYLTVHPHSYLVLCWDVLCIVAVCWDIAVAPLRLMSKDWAYGTVELIANIFWTCDILCKSRIGFYQGGKIVFNFCEILQHYAKTWLAFDVVLVVLGWVSIWSMSSGQSPDVQGIVRIAFLTRLLRAFKLQPLLHDIHCCIHNVNVVVGMRISWQILLMVGLLHITACMWWGIGSGSSGGWIEAVNISKEPGAEGYALSLTWAAAHLSGVTKVHPVTLEEHAFSALLTVFCVNLLVFLISNTANMLQDRRYHKSEYFERAVRSFLGRYNVSRSVALQIQKGVADESRFRKQRERDDEVMRLLPSDLLKELMVEVRGPGLVAKSRLFGFLWDAFPQFFRELCFEAVQHERARQSQVIFTAGEVCHAIRCVSSGKLRYEPSQGLPDFSNRATCRLVTMRPQTVRKGDWISEAALWVDWKHLGELCATEDCETFIIPVSAVDKVVNMYREVHGTLALYAQQFALYVNGEGASDLIRLASWVWDAEHFDPAAGPSPAVSVPLPFHEFLPAHISENVCIACVQMARNIAVGGLDENRPHHGFVVVVGDPVKLDECGKAGFNPFLGHNLSVIGADGGLDQDVFDLVRRNAFNTDGAIVVDGSCGTIAASGWFVGDISQGGLTGGARSRAARAVAQQAGICYVIKCSEDSTGELNLHLGKKRKKLDCMVDERATFANHNASPDFYTI